MCRAHNDELSAGELCNQCSAGPPRVGRNLRCGHSAILEDGRDMPTSTDDYGPDRFTERRARLHQALQDRTLPPALPDGRGYRHSSSNVLTDKTSVPAAMIAANTRSERSRIQPGVFLGGQPCWPRRVRTQMQRGPLDPLVAPYASVDTDGMRRSADEIRPNCQDQPAGPGAEGARIPPAAMYADVFVRIGKRCFHFGNPVNTDSPDGNWLARCHGCGYQMAGSRPGRVLVIAVAVSLTKLHGMAKGEIQYFLRRLRAVGNPARARGHSMEP